MRAGRGAREDGPRGGRESGVTNERERLELPAKPRFRLKRIPRPLARGASSSPARPSLERMALLPASLRVVRAGDRLHPRTDPPGPDALAGGAVLAAESGTAGGSSLASSGATPSDSPFWASSPLRSSGRATITYLWEVPSGQVAPTLPASAAAFAAGPRAATAAASTRPHQLRPTIDASVSSLPSARSSAPRPRSSHSLASSRRASRDLVGSPISSHWDAKSPASVGFTATTNGRSPSRSRLSRSTSRSRPGSRARSVSLSLSRSGTAGYVSPTSRRTLTESALSDAATLLHREGIERFLPDPVFRYAASKVGVPIEDLRARSPESFRETMADSPRTLDLRHARFEEKRVESLAFILNTLPTASEEVEVLEDTSRHFFREIEERLEDSLARERERLASADEARKKLITVAERENEIIRRRRERMAYAESKRLAAEERRKAEDQWRRDLLAMQREERTELARQAKEQRLQRQRERAMEERAAKERIAQQLDRTREQREAHVRQKLADTQITNAMREMKRHAAIDEHDHRRAILLRRLRAAEQEREMLRAEQAEQRRQLRDAKWTERQRRRENAERIRREREFAFQQNAVKLDRVLTKIDQLQEIRHALDLERQEAQRRARIEMDEWRSHAVLERKITPGPSDYFPEVERLRKIPGRGFAAGPSKRYGDLLVDRAAETPGPGVYMRRNSVIKGGTMPTAPAARLIESVAEKAASMPAVGDYDLVAVDVARRRRLVSPMSGGSPSHDLRFIDQVVARAKELPGPSDIDTRKATAPVGRVRIDDIRSKLAEMRLTQTIHSVMSSSAGRSQRGDEAASPMSPLASKRLTRRRMSQVELEQLHVALRAAEAELDVEEAMKRGDLASAEQAADAAERAAEEAVRLASLAPRTETTDFDGFDAPEVTAKAATEIARRARRASLDLTTLGTGFEGDGAPPGARRRSIVAAEGKDASERERAVTPVATGRRRSIVDGSAAAAAAAATAAAEATEAAEAAAGSTEGKANVGEPARPSDGHEAADGPRNASEGRGATAPAAANEEERLA